MWPGVQPERNTFNSTYLDKIEEIVDALGEKGIYSLLDMHQVISSVTFLNCQDLLSRKFCGEGAPDWAIEVTDTLLKFPYPALMHELPVEPGTGYPELDAYVLHLLLLTQ